MENVKTFLRLIIIITIASIIISDIFVTYRPRDHFIKELIHISWHQIKTMKECYMYKERFLTHTIGYSAIVLLIPLHKLIIYPATQKCFPSIKIYQIFLLGTAIQIINITIELLFDITARRVYSEHHENVSQCIFQQAISSNYNSGWMAITLILDSLSQALLFISAIEFLVSQTPYSMRGLIFGAGYGSVFLFTIIGYGIYWPFIHLPKSWGTGIISCEFWYQLLVLLVMVTSSGLLLVAVRWYKNRKREDVLPNEHIFAERFYGEP